MYTKQLIREGISANVKGFWYLNYAIEIFEPRGKIMNLYGDVAKHFNTTAGRVERAMRVAIAKAGIKSVNSEFIAVKNITWNMEGKNE